MIYIGFSGGVDSVVLLHQLKQTCPEITAIYVNHHISKNSDDWEKFCAEFCHQNGISFIAKQVFLNGKSENEARSLRYEAYRECCSEIYLAHHADDDVETILFRMIRGSGLSGMAGISSGNENFGLTVHRPLLHLTKNEIIDYANAHHLEWVTDESNKLDGYSRNFLRNKIIPAIKERFPSFVPSMLRLKENMVEANDLMNEIAEEDLLHTQMEIKKILLLSENRRKNLIRFFIKKEVGNLPSASKLNEFVRQIEESKNGKKPKIQVGDTFIFVKNKRLISQKY